ncbi:hypothetical protein [Aureimonas leprariae]|uniref:hypothetical protein n=1 Tax=Plantimonas leprariae TaxID=2615207 RepID=UPI001386CF5F|nr:hypothetical protein [Aureimonas leprariae]
MPSHVRSPEIGAPARTTGKGTYRKSHLHPDGVDDTLCQLVAKVRDAAGELERRHPPPQRFGLCSWREDAGQT